MRERERRNWGQNKSTWRAVRCWRWRRRRLTAWKTCPRCTARPSAIHPRMAAHTDAARSTRRASEPSCPGSSRGPSAAGGGCGGGGGEGARASHPELVKNPAAGTGAGSGGRRRRSSVRSSSIAAELSRCAQEHWTLPASAAVGSEINAPEGTHEVLALFSSGGKKFCVGILLILSTK